MTARDGARPRSRRSIVIALCALLLPLLAMEVGVRVLIAAGWVTAAPSRDAQVDVGALMRAAEPRQDVLLLGDSLVRRGVEPAVLATLIEQATGRPAAVASMAQLDVDVRSMSLRARQLGTAERLPRVMLLGLSMGNYGGPRANPGARAIEHSPMGQLVVGCGAEEFPVAWLECQLGQVSAAWRWRGQPSRLLDRLLAAGTLPEFATPDGTLRRDGFEVTPGMTQAQLDRLAATSYRGQVVDITPTRLETASTALQELVAYLEGEGVQVVMFSVPYPPPLLDAIRARTPDLAIQDAAALDALASAAGLPVVHTREMADWWRPQDSSDLKHLSASGADAFTHQLWAMPLFRERVLRLLDDQVTSVPP